MARTTRSTQTNDTVEGRFCHLIYSPHGGVEGVLLDAEGGALQLVFEREDEAGPAAFEGVAAGQAIIAKAEAQGPSPKGPAEHPVYAFVALKSIDGQRPKKPSTRPVPAYQGRVVRLNHARHGAANGVVLDTGDFIHLRPEGMALLKLKIGDLVQADGDAHYLALGRGWAVEAVKVNGKTVRPA